MAGQYSHKQFFRKVPNTQLADYFESKKVDIELDFKELKESDVDAIFTAFNKLAEDQQGAIEADFQDINALACDAGIQALNDEAEFHLDESFGGELANIDGLHSKTMWVFLNKKEYWRGASMFLRADKVSYSYWKKRNDLPNAEPHVDDADIELLANGISAYFSKTEGRGKNCKVEPYRRHNKEYFFAYPEDYAQSGVEWVSDKLQTRARHPAFEIIFVYSEEEGSLDIFAPRNTKAVKELQKLFATTILKLPTLKDGTIDKRTYDLKPVTDKHFEFTTTPDMGIDSVSITRLRLKLKQGTGLRRITLDANNTDNPQAVFDLLGELNVPDYIVDQIGVLVVFESVGNKAGQKQRFNVSYPNSCALSHDGNDLKIRKMLASSGLEPS